MPDQLILDIIGKTNPQFQKLIDQLLSIQTKGLTIEAKLSQSGQVTSLVKDIKTLSDLTAKSYSIQLNTREAQAAIKSLNKEAEISTKQLGEMIRKSISDSYQKAFNFDIQKLIKQSGPTQPYSISKTSPVALAQSFQAFRGGQFSTQPQSFSGPRMDRRMLSDPIIASYFEQARKQASGRTISGSLGSGGGLPFYSSPTGPPNFGGGPIYGGPIGPRRPFYGQPAGPQEPPNPRLFDEYIRNIIAGRQQEFLPGGRVAKSQFDNVRQFIQQNQTGQGNLAIRNRTRLNAEDTAKATSFNRFYARPLLDALRDGRISLQDLQSQFTTLTAPGGLYTGSKSVNVLSQAVLDKAQRIDERNNQQVQAAIKRANEFNAFDVKTKGAFKTAQDIGTAKGFNQRQIKQLTQGLGQQKAFDVSRLNSFEAIQQVGFAYLFGGVRSALGAGLAGSFLGAPGVFLGSAITQTIGRQFDAIFNSIVEKLKTVAEAGLEFQRSIVGIASIFQATSRVIGRGGQTLGIPEQLAFQEQRARGLQIAARQRLAPLGISGQSEVSLIRAITAGSSRRGGLANPQILDLAEGLGAAAQSLAPEILQNPALLSRDIRDIISGTPTAGRTALGSALGPELIKQISTAVTPEDFERVNKALKGFVDTLNNSGDAIISFNKISATFQNSITTLGDAFLRGLEPALKRIADVVTSDNFKQGAQNFASRLESLGSILGNITIGIINLWNAIPGPIKAVFGGAALGGIVGAGAGAIGGLVPGFAVGGIPGALAAAGGGAIIGGVQGATAGAALGSVAYVAGSVAGALNKPTGFAAGDRTLEKQRIDLQDQISSARAERNKLIQTLGERHATFIDVQGIQGHIEQLNTKISQLQSQLGAKFTPSESAELKRIQELTGVDLSKTATELGAGPSGAFRQLDQFFRDHPNSLEFSTGQVALSDLQEQLFNQTFGTQVTQTTTKGRLGLDRIRDSQLFGPQRERLETAKTNVEQRLNETRDKFEATKTSEERKALQEELDKLEQERLNINQKIFDLDERRLKNAQEITELFLTITKSVVDTTSIFGEKSNIILDSISKYADLTQKQGIGPQTAQTVAEGLRAGQEASFFGEKAEQVAGFLGRFGGNEAFPQPLGQPLGGFTKIFENIAKSVADQFEILNDKIRESQRAFEDFTEDFQLRKLGRQGRAVSAAEKLLQAGGTESEIPGQVPLELVRGSVFFDQNRRQEFERTQAAAEAKAEARDIGPSRETDLEEEQRRQLLDQVRGAQGARTTGIIQTANQFVNFYKQFAGTDLGNLVRPLAEGSLGQIGDFLQNTGGITEGRVNQQGQLTRGITGVSPGLNFNPTDLIDKISAGAEEQKKINTALSNLPAKLDAVINAITGVKTGVTAELQNLERQLDL